MVYRSSNSSLAKDTGVSVCTVLHGDRVVDEEFPRVDRTEIVRLGELKTANVEKRFSAVTAAGTASAEYLSDRRGAQQQRRSGRFSLFSWFKKGNEDLQIENGEGCETEKNHQQNSINKSVVAERDLRATIYSSSGSVDTTCSTATVHSFTFRSGPDIVGRRQGRLQYFRKHSSADDFVAPRHLSVSQFDSELSICDRDCTVCFENGGKGELKKDTVTPSSTKNISSVNQNNKAQSHSFYGSLPTAGKTADLTNNKKRFAHVRGKRPAPKPPTKLESQASLLTEEKRNNTIRRKRQAPKPPVDEVGKSGDSEETKKCTGLISAACNTSMTNEIVKGNLDKKNSAIINDTLKLEDGILLPRRSPEKSSPVEMNQVMTKPENSERTSGVKKSVLSCTNLQTSHTVLPRPWYKRSNTTLSERDICGSFRRDVLKIPTLSKLPRDKGGQFSLHHDQSVDNNSSKDSPTNNSELNSIDKSFSRLNHLFGRSDGSKTKKDEKRKSNLSILTNISELDREAAAIVQEEQARNQAFAKSLVPSASNEPVSTPSGDIISEMVSSSIEPQRRGTRALISKFNAISNITKVTVNATFFTKSAGGQSSPKIDVVRSGDQRNNKNDRNIVTKRLLCDGTERVNETGDISSINFFRRLEAEASQIPESHSTTAAQGWEEKIKRYFPERNSRAAGNKKEEFLAASTALRVADTEKNHFAEQREFRNLNRSFELERDGIRNVDKIEHLSRADLKEMLIEMKHSLPKRPKQKSSSAAGKSPVTTNNDRVPNVSKTQSEIIEGKSSSVNKAVTSNRLSKLETGCRNDGKRPMKSNGAIGRPVDLKFKVSSAAQTSANLRKIEIETLSERSRGIDSPRYKSGGKISEDTIYTTKGRKSASGAALTRNTFQLIRPRDFACIEALKTEKGGAVGRESQNTYMNVIEDSIYANAIINPPKVVNSDDKYLTKNDLIRGKNVNDDKKKPDNNNAENVKLRQELPRKPEVKISESETFGGSQKEEPAESVTNMNTMAINRLLRKLEGAIASGQHQQAAGLAKELAQLKIHCSVVRQRSGNNQPSNFINVDMYIEDKLAHQGPIPLQLSLNMTVAELKNKIFAEFEIPTNVQRWIIGKNLADDDDFTINELKAVDKSSIFLYLVAPDLQNTECTRADSKPVVNEEVAEKALINDKPPEIALLVEEEPKIIPTEEINVEEELKLKRYEHLMSLENSDVIPNSVPIECPICFAPYGPYEGVILRDCLHMFCRTCIANTIMYCEEAEVKCPFRDSEYTCESTLQEREIKALVTPEVYEQHLAKSVSQAENNAGNNAFHCKTPDCPGWCIYDDNVNVFLCPACGVNNCLTCQAIHTNKNCREYQDEIRLLKETDQETKRTAAVLEEMVESGEALACPTCAVVLMKKWGCDWLRCSMCKTEICWVTRGPRWGPAGKGDTSGGCKCGENGVKCHPRCNYCH